ncbi:unnamed protein product [Kuraishia capsulata CBS 1993]|uniref:Histone deacetylase interacting domain-containing protein n=1 Tax=Kuraishia capsulata CBS 1993 TaxID=1382522 RepID=W6MME5_9ASCO|nr:uncharacterized protein KUCA_T00002053001 [Kuraishia capsulata CBS 1993]CDK26082.1 unnamed protein product [Kuraishia capsulata CBS 1993]
MVPGAAQQPPPPQTGAGALPQYRPLNVKDALSYLDQVKVQFQHQTDVYNHFLDIMKDFKCQNIDTPGVIDRVSTLFRGHPNLIQGFNTFLPPGYRIECSLDPSDPNPIRVTTPMGTTTRHDSGALDGLSYEQKWGSLAQQSQSQQQQQQQQQQAPPPSQLDYRQYAEAQQHQQPPMHHVNGNLQQHASEEMQPVGDSSPVEFNHAITYVNKIKTRFSNEPDIYKNFLENLQMYQKGLKPINEVYQQVIVLFQNAPDLLDDFKQFLPDTSAQQMEFQPAQQMEYYDKSHYGKVQLPPVGNFPTPAVIQGKEKKKKSISVGYDQQQQAFPEPPVSSVRGSPKRRSRDVSDSPSMLPGVPEPVRPSTKGSSLSEEVSFFDKVKRAISNKQTYNEFLKMINLYSHDIIDKETLIERVDGFIGQYRDLFEWFKQFVGYEDKPLHIENITFKKHQMDLSLCKSCGPSYRLLPKAETYMPCSGRDEMCWEVLNDEWVGHPTWASEDSGFVAHKKNQYEEILFRIEEERHEYDFYMEANLRTIQTLETIANRIANMTPEEKMSFKLPPGLNHNSVTIYKKVIRKIYDKTSGFEVIDALHDNPAIAVPIVLKRLKQKDEEWKRSHREWNKVWREMEQKVFYKSLDHLGLTFKQTDKKLLTSKQLVSEISTIKMEQTQKRLNPYTAKPKEQLNYKFEDFDVMMDILKLVIVFLRHSSTYSANDKERLETFLKDFYVSFFALSPEFIESEISQRITKEEDEALESEESGAQTASVTLSQSKKRSRYGDLLKDVLRKNKSLKTMKSDDGSDDSIPGSPVPEGDVNGDVPAEVEEASKTWVNTIGSEKALSAAPAKRSEFNFFSNTPLYVFFRYLQALYERLYEIKLMNDEVDNEIKSRKEVQFAKDLDLISHNLEDMGINFTGSDSYAQVLEFSERLIEGELEHQWFEETLRQGYRNKAFKLFTVDKVVAGIVKHMHSIVTDHRTSEMIDLMVDDRHKRSTTAKEQILYRMQVRSLMGPEENMFNILFNETKNTVDVSFVAVSDLTLRNNKSLEDEWNYYLTTYSMSHPTEGIPTSKISIPFLRNSIDEDDDDTTEYEGVSDSKLKVKVDLNTYKLFFEPKGYDEFTRKSVYAAELGKFKSQVQRLDALKAALDGESGWKKDLEEEEQHKFQEKFDLLATKGGDEYSAFSTEPEPKPEEVLPEEPVTETAETTSLAEAKPEEAAVHSHHPADITVDGDSTMPQDDTLEKVDVEIRPDDKPSLEDVSMGDADEVAPAA